MIRGLIAALIVIIGAGFCSAEGGDPYTYVLTRTFDGMLLQHPRDTSHALQISAPAIWNAGADRVSVMANGALHPANNISGEIIGVAYWDQSVVVLHRLNGRVVVSLYDTGLTRKLTPDVDLPEVHDLDDGAVLLTGIYALPNSGVAYLHAGRFLYRLVFDSNQLRKTFVDRDVSAVQAGSYDGGWELTYLHTSGLSMFVSIIDSRGNVVNTTLVPYAFYSKLQRQGATIAVISDLESSGSSVVSVLDRKMLAVRTRTISIPSERLELATIDSHVVVVALTTRTGRPELLAVPVYEQYDQLPSGELISGDFGTPLRLTVQQDTAYMLFSGGMVVMLLDGSVLARDAFTVSGTAHRMYARDNGQLVVAEVGRTTIQLQRKEQPFWFLVRGYDLVLRYVVPMLFIGALIFVWVLNRRQRRLLDGIIDSPAMGLVFTVDSSGKLLRVNERAAGLLRITPNVPMGRHFRAYMQQAGLEQLVQHLDTIKQSRLEPTKKIAIQSGDEYREYIFSTTPLIGLFGSARGAIVTGIDITETLEQRRLVNWAQLAHDMQTNLSTIRLNAEQLPNVPGEPPAERRRRILFQVGVLINRVRDLLTIGRTDELMRVAVHSAELCTEIRHEFDNDMFPHVTFSMKLRGTMMNVDRMKISRAVRNAVENAMKALRGEPGTIEIATWHDSLHVFISVSDSGVGMDPDTMANMMKPYFSTTQDGTGHGIGTMIMHHVMKLHGGTIRVTSEPGNGTQVVFRIPHEMDPKDVLRLATMKKRA
ncbi:MAG: GHKL domain-containing protein [Ignavibacteria bacterium]|nr:GHKL domain-containing protein [Ignavibacteria bacterium]